FLSLLVSVAGFSALRSVHAFVSAAFTASSSVFTNAAYLSDSFDVSSVTCGAAVSGVAFVSPFDLSFLSSLSLSSLSLPAVVVPVVVVAVVVVTVVVPVVVPVVDLSSSSFLSSSVWSALTSSSLPAQATAFQAVWMLVYAAL